MHAQVLLGAARAVLATLEDASVDAIVTDPPAGVAFMGKEWDGHKGGRDQWIAWLASIMAEARRCIKPSGYALVWALPRTSHWTATALDDGGWRIIDIITHHFGQGFPKGKGQLKPASEHWILCRAPGPLQPLQIDACRVATGEIGAPRAYEPRQDREQWRIPGGSNGSGATSPAGRWPPNTLFSHVGGPDGCRPAGVRRVRGAGWRDTDGAGGQKIAPGAVLGNRQSALPRPATGHHTDADGYETAHAWTCHPQCPVRVLDEQAGPRSVSGSARNGRPSAAQPQSIFGGPRPQGRLHDDAGSASRFFPTFAPDQEDEDADGAPFRYVPKASRAERQAGCEALPYERAGVLADDSYVRPADGKAGDTTRTIRGNTHPTVKPLALMSWLVRLVTPAGGVVLDPFCGSGSTLVAAVQQGFGFIGIEQDPEYVDIARARIAHEQEQRLGPLFAPTSGAGAVAR